MAPGPLTRPAERASRKLFVTYEARWIVDVILARVVSRIINMRWPHLPGKSRCAIQRAEWCHFDFDLMIHELSAHRAQGSTL